MDRLHMIFHGRVQGVWFRANCQKKAIELGLNGWVMNLPDGNVEVVIEGDKEKVEEHLHWCQNHQPYAKVTDVEVEWETATGEFLSFTIKR